MEIKSTDKPIYTDLSEAVKVARYKRDLMAFTYAIYSAFPPILTVERYDVKDTRHPIYLAIANIPMYHRNIE